MRREVIEGARAGDREAFEALAASVLDRLCGAALLILHDRALQRMALLRLMASRSIREPGD